MLSDTDVKESKINLTQQEAEQFEKAFQNDEFKQLFTEYLKEVQDPAVKAKYEAEIAQLEAERGNHIRWVKPTPGFVMKTNYADVPQNIPETTDPISVDSKVFVNICSSAEIGKPTSTIVKRNSKAGQNWSIPLSLTGAREDFDHAKKSCIVYDAIFHPEALELGQMYPTFKETLVQTAFEHIESKFQVKLQRKCKLIRMRYKGLPSATVIREPMPKESKNLLEETNHQDFLQQLMNRKSGEPSLGAGEDLIQDINNETGESLEEEKSNAPVVPKYEIIHRGNLSYQDFLNERERYGNERPDELVVRIWLPCVVSASDISLDSSPTAVSIDVPDKYYLHLNLPFKVNDDEGSAKFDKGKACLTIALPVEKAKMKSSTGSVTTKKNDKIEEAKKSSVDKIQPVLSSPQSSEEVCPLRLGGSITSPQQPPDPPKLLEVSESNLDPQTNPDISKATFDTLCCSDSTAAQSYNFPALKESEIVSTTSEASDMFINPNELKLYQNSRFVVLSVTINTTIENSDKLRKAIKFNFHQDGVLLHLSTVDEPFFSVKAFNAFNPDDSTVSFATPSEPNDSVIAVLKFRKICEDEWDSIAVCISKAMSISGSDKWLEKKFITRDEKIETSLGVWGGSSVNIPQYRKVEVNEERWVADVQLDFIDGDPSATQISNMGQAISEEPVSKGQTTMENEGHLDIGHGSNATMVRDTCSDDSAKGSKPGSPSTLKFRNNLIFELDD
ncbi:pre-RNA processing PIH1/Nop17-domain-containing protein [Paraphysoderma sedebokerense]|nr:pre-RNA processing PIH1/Nop17-domain-containing protein [Paraphysoderma sedebokerense]